jgi:CheY-like chemotaxis protein
MPKCDGFCLLEHLKSYPEWQVIPTIVLSASDDEDDIKKAYMLGASSYFVKPASYSHLQDLVNSWLVYWKKCEVPRVDKTGKRLKTEAKGKLGERFRKA